MSQTPLVEPTERVKGCGGERVTEPGSLPPASRVPGPCAPAPLQSPGLEWVWLLGIRVTRLTPDSALEALQSFIQSGRPHMVVTADSSGVVTAAHDVEFQRIVNE